MYPQTSPRLVIASRNEKKRIELEELLSGASFRILSLKNFPDCPEVEETGKTFSENAALKAVQVASHTGLWTLADDSGLLVDALGGLPGVHSARYAAGNSTGNSTDQENILLLLKNLQGVPDDQRTARFACAIALAQPRDNGQAVVVAESFGTVEGRIIHEPRGEQGFGYDPIFLIPEYGKTFGELGAEIKHQISHRFRALNNMIPTLLEYIRE